MYEREDNLDQSSYLDSKSFIIHLTHYKSGQDPISAHYGVDLDIWPQSV